MTCCVHRSQSFTHASVCVALCFALLALCGCDPFSFLDKYNPNPPKPATAKPKKKKTDAVVPVEAVAVVYRADLMRVVVGGKTQLVHIAGICAPSSKRGAANDALARLHGLVPNALPYQARAGIAYIQEVASNEALKLAILEWRTNSAEEVYIEGDLLCGGIEPVSGRLLEKGFAAVQPPTPRTSVFYDEIQTRAQEEEVGMWGYAGSLSCRLSVASTFEIKTLGNNKNDVYTQSQGTQRRLLESHVTIEKAGQIYVRINAAKPMWHPYNLTFHYAFRSKTDEGRDSVEKNDGGTRRTGATNVSAAAAAPVMSTMSVLLESPSTNILLESPPVAYTLSTKGSVNYGMGDVLTGYDLEVWYGSNLVYSHYHIMPKDK